MGRGKEKKRPGEPRNREKKRRRRERKGKTENLIVHAKELNQQPWGRPQGMEKESKSYKTRERGLQRTPADSFFLSEDFTVTDSSAI